MVRGLPAVGDLVITTEAPLGEVALIDESSVALAQRIILIKANTLRASAAYLWCYFRSVLGRAELKMRATGSTAAGIKASHLRSVPVVVPSEELQGDIVEAYRAREREVGFILRSLMKSTDLLHEQRSALTTAVVTGQIDVRQHATRLR
jgi:type I restriction enzyme, S subunit